MCKTPECFGQQEHDSKLPVAGRNRAGPKPSMTCFVPSASARTGGGNGRKEQLWHLQDSRSDTKRIASSH